MTDNTPPAAQSDQIPTPDPSLEDLEDGHAPDGALADVVDSLEAKVLQEQDNPVLDVDRDADAKAVESDPEHTGDEAQPPV